MIQRAAGDRFATAHRQPSGPGVARLTRELAKQSEDKAHLLRLGEAAVHHGDQSRRRHAGSAPLRMNVRKRAQASVGKAVPIQRREDQQQVGLGASLCCCLRCGRVAQEIGGRNHLYRRRALCEQGLQVLPDRL